MKLMKRFWNSIKNRPQRSTAITALLLILFGFSLKLLLGVGVILIVGIGDGYPTIGMKAFGAAILLVTALIGLGIGAAFIASLFCLVSNRTVNSPRKGALIVAVVAILGIAVFFAWKRGGEDAAVDAIIHGDMQAYRAAASRRSKGSIDDDLWLAARWGRAEIVKALLQEGARANARLGGTGSTVLEAATENLGNQPNGNAEVIGILRGSVTTNIFQLNR